MSLAPGTTFDRYEITSLLGSGGMGEVYLARDLRLERKVAIKILPSGFTRDTSRIQRFKQEAKADKPTEGGHLLLKFVAPQG